MTATTEHMHSTEQVATETGPKAVALEAPPLSADIETALGLADFAPMGPTSCAVVGRLRDHISASLEEANRYVISLPCGSRDRDIAAETIRYAGTLMTRHCPDPAARLRLHAKAAQHICRYADTYRERGRARVS